MPDRIYQVGDVIAGDYIVRRVMEGGLGIVYAVDHRGGDRLVLKGPKRQSDHAVRESFRNEAETWVRLGEHTNIVPAFWVDELAGQLFVAAEFVESDELDRVSLRDYLRHGALRPNVVAAWTADFCYGLEHALSKGLVAHRDIKPENLLISASGVLRVTDFGIAKAMVSTLEGGSSKQSKLGAWQTRSGKVSGTPPYMAPEQWRGAEQDIRTDIYAFGVVMYEMCYGRMPFVSPSIEKLIDLHLHIEPQIPHGTFAQVIARCLSKDPAARYATLSDLLADVSRICAAQEIPLPPAPSPMGERASDLAALAHGLGAVGKHKEALAAARELVDLEPNQAGSWTQLARLLLEGGDVEAALIAIERSLALDETRSSAWNNLGLILGRQQKWQQAVWAFDRALDCDAANTGALSNSAESLRHIGRGGDAIARLTRAAEIAPDKFIIWNNLGKLYFDIGDRQKALDCLKRARVLAPSRHQPQIDEAISFTQKLPDEISGAAAMAAGDMLIARERLIEEVHQNPNDKNAWHNLGLVHIQIKEYADARQCFDRVHAIDPKDGFAICRLIELSALLDDLSSVAHWCSVLSHLPNGEIAAIAFKARALAHCDKYQDAKQLILDAVRKHPNEPDLLIACGDVMMVYPGSATAMSNATKVYQRAAEVLQQRGNDVSRLRDIENRLKQARENLDRCLRESEE